MTSTAGNGDSVGGNETSTSANTTASIVWTRDDGRVGDTSKEDSLQHKGNDDDDDKLTKAARCLLLRLQGDFRAEGKRTCRDCLRTKSLPCSRVVEVAESDVFAQHPPTTVSAVPILRTAYEMLLDEYTSLLPADSPAVTNRPLSSLDCMNRACVILRFVQLLLRLSERPSSSDDGPVLQMTETLLKGWTRGICDFANRCPRIHPNHHNDDNDDDDAPTTETDSAPMEEDESCKPKDCRTADATHGLAPGPVVCYAFSSLLRMNEYVPTRGALLVPVWKCLCALAKVLVVEGDDEDPKEDDWRDSVPPNLLEDAIRILGDFLQEGLGRLQLEACRRLGEPDDDTGGGGAERIAFQGKFVGFLVTRMGHLLTVYFSIRSRRSEISSTAVLQGVWRSLLGLRGMAAALQLLHAAGTCSVGIEPPTDHPMEVAVLKVYCELAAKAGNCIADAILPKQHSQQQHRPILVSGLESLLQSDMVTQQPQQPGNEFFGHEDSPKDLRCKWMRMSLLARTMGKVSVLQQVLEMAAVDGKCGSSNPESVEPLLATIEHLHSTSVPQCFSACLIAVRCNSKSAIVTTPTTIVLESLQRMTRALTEIEWSLEKTSSPKLDAFYRLLVRWLAIPVNTSDPTTNGNCTVKNGGEFVPYEHPLSRELVLSLLHAHIVGYSDTPNQNGCCRHRPTKLLSYLAKLLFDARTRTTLRKNIGALFLRLQSSPAKTSCTSVAGVAAKELVQKEFLLWLNTTTSRKRHSKKRKRTRPRKHLGSHLGQQDAMIIARVLATCRGISQSWSEEYQRVLRREFSMLSSDCIGDSSKREMALLACAERNALLLAWLEGCVAMGPETSLETIRQTTGLDLLGGIVRPVVSGISDLRFPKLGPHGGGDDAEILPKKVLLYSAAMRLSVTLATVFGDHETLPMDKIGLLLKHSVSKDPWDQSNRDDENASFVQDQKSILQFEALNLLGSIAKSIPNDCSERVLRMIRRAFVVFLSSKRWPVASLGVSSVISFASDLKEAHQQILPLCLPKVSMGLFQARASGDIWKGTTTEDPNRSTQESGLDAVDRISGHLDRCTVAATWDGPKQSSVRNILPSTATTAIAPGSYVLEMPTQEDRTATVIFPPGPKSLQDIQYMLGGMGDEAAMTTHLLKRAVVTPGGVVKLALVPS